MFDNLIWLAGQVPGAGLNDVKALDKFNAESQELEECLANGDELGAILEAGDCAYYAAKAWQAGLIDFDKAIKMASAEAYRVGLPLGKVVLVAEAKYTLRTRQKKNDTAEREAALKVLEDTKV